MDHVADLERERLNRRKRERRRRQAIDDFMRENHCGQCGVPLLFYEELTHCGSCVEKAEEDFYLDEFAQSK